MGAEHAWPSGTDEQYTPASVACSVDGASVHEPCWLRKGVFRFAVKHVPVTVTLLHAG